MADNSLDIEERAPQPSVPPVPEDLEYEASWTTRTPSGDEVEVQLWVGYRSRDWLVRICQGLILGVVPARDAAAEPEEEVVELYGRAWVDAQFDTGRKLLKFRWNRS